MVIFKLPFLTAAQLHNRDKLKRGFFRKDNKESKSLGEKMKREYKRQKKECLQYLGQNVRNGWGDHSNKRIGSKREPLADLPGKFTSFTSTRDYTVLDKQTIKLRIFQIRKNYPTERGQ